VIKARACEILKEREFVSIATCDFSGRPNAASKFILKVEGDFIYLVDYVIGRTYANLTINPHASLSFVDTSTLKGYQINGMVEVINKGQEYNKLIEDLRQKEIELSIQRIVEGVYKGKSHSAYEVATTDKSVFFKVKINEVVEMGMSGILKREKL